MIMKKNRLFIILLLTAGLMTACSELKDDSHYGNTSTVITNTELKIVNESSESYIQKRTDLTSMSTLFTQEGIYDELNKKGQLSTILVVTNEHFVKPTDKVNFITRSHVSDISMSPANLRDGERLMMWHGKYVNVSIDEEGLKGNIIDHVNFNNGAVREVIKTNNGYIYVIDEMISTPTSLNDYINNLSDDYSMFKNMVLSSGGKEFDRANSKAIGINEQGNTVYDSVFIYTNKFFEERGFDMNSESLTATMLLFSNNVINAALEEAHQRLEKWELTRSDSLMKDWILKVAFFNKKYTSEQISHSEELLTSIFSKDWDTQAQQVDAENPDNLSNGVVYKVKQLILPHNVLIYRLKDYFYYYENCKEDQKEEYFKMTDMVFKECKTEVEGWTPLAGVWPVHENRVLRLDKAADATDESGFNLDFTPVKLNDDGTVSPYLIPPGKYRLAMGSVQNQGLDIVVTVLADGVEVAKSETISWGTSTTYHYDRGTTLENRYPEGYDPTVVQEIGGNKKAGNYDTDGGRIIDELTIPDINGDNSPAHVVFRIMCANWNGKSNVKLHHWCLRPLPFNK